MTNFAKFKIITVDELADFLDEFGQFDGSPWTEWFGRNYCDKCVNELACPAISKIDGKITIDEAQCDGCNVCIQVCKYGALQAGRE